MKGILCKSIILSLLFLVLFSVAAYSQQMKQLQQIDKLPILSIHCIFQDREGYIWYGTDRKSVV